MEIASFSVTLKNGASKRPRSSLRKCPPMGLYVPALSGLGCLNASELKRSLGISDHPLRAREQSSQRLSGDVTSPGSLQDMPTIATGNGSFFLGFTGTPYESVRDPSSDDEDDGMLVEGVAATFPVRTLACFLYQQRL